jgi:hypothetical protein
MVRLLSTLNNSCQFQMPLMTVRGLNSILAEALYGARTKQIQESISEDKLSLESLSEFLSSEVIEEFDKDGVPRLISRHCEQIQYDLGILGKSLTTSDLPSESANKFLLNLGSHSLEISLYQHDNKRRSLGLLSYSVSESDKLIFESPKQWFHYRSLLSLAAYLDLAASTSIPDQKLREYWWSISNSLYRNLHKTLLILQVLPQEDEPATINKLRLQVMVNTDPSNEHKDITDIDNHLTFEEIVDEQNTYSFVASLKELFARSSG